MVRWGWKGEGAQHELLCGKGPAALVERGDDWLAIKYDPVAASWTD